MRVCRRCRSIYFSDPPRCGIDGEPLIEQEEDPLIGTTLDGRYEILNRLGSGAMATVYRARHTALDFEYAIKVLAGDFSAKETTSKRFRREALLMSRMQHPNIVAVKDFGTTSTGLTFLAMEFVRGHTLKEAIEQRAPMKSSVVAKIVRQIASGLWEAHRLGYVHRDLKPSNVILSGGVAKILDFGLVGLHGKHDSDISSEGLVLGTPAYMAPEQASLIEVGPSADLYSLGIIAYEMLTGHVPFRGRTVAETLVMHIMHEPPELRSHGLMETLARELLAKSPAERPSSAQVVVSRIDRQLAMEHTRSSESDDIPGFEPSSSAFSLTADLIAPPRGSEGPVESATRPERQRLGSILVEGAYISPVQLEAALKIVHSSRKRLGRTLVDQGYLTEEHLVRALARHIILDECNPELPVHPSALAAIPCELAERHIVIPVGLKRTREGAILVVATFDPFDEDAAKAVHEAVGERFRIQWALATERAIRSGIARHYYGASQTDTLVRGPLEPRRLVAKRKP